jgi:hypothetical protein
VEEPVALHLLEHFLEDQPHVLVRLGGTFHVSCPWGRVSAIKNRLKRTKLIIMLKARSKTK